MKNSENPIGNRTRDLPACSAVSEPTATPRAPIRRKYPRYLLNRKLGGPRGRSERFGEHTNSRALTGIRTSTPVYYTDYAKRNFRVSETKLFYLAFNLVHKERTTLIVTISGEFLAERLSCLYNVEAKSWWKQT